MAKLTRRQMILGAIGSATILPLSYTLSVSFGNYPFRQGLKILTNKEAAIIDALGEVIVPPQNEIGLSIEEAHVVEGVDSLMATMSPQGQSRIKLVLWVVEHLIPIRNLYFKKFTRLTVSQRENILQKLETSNATATRAFARALKGLIQLIYFNNTQVQDRLGIVDRCHI